MFRPLLAYFGGGVWVPQAVEARISSAKSYWSQNGVNMGEDLSCDGGPLANSAHDPRWGRIAETYGEDPMHIQTMGVGAMLGLQNPMPVPGGRPSDVFFATRQVTRHYIGYHSASPDIGPPSCHQFGSCNFVASNRSLADSYFPTYGPLSGFFHCPVGWCCVAWLCCSFCAAQRRRLNLTALDDRIPNRCHQYGRVGNSLLLDHVLTT